MASSSTAQGLASLGRNGDSMLMHVSPSEVRGLKQAGDSLGIKMTTNPYTGMPEAFNFGSFLSSFLPTIAGIAAAPATGGFSMAPILAGAGTGAVLAAAKGEDPLMGTLMGGFGGYGGGNLAGTFGKMSTAGSNAITNNVANNALYKGSLGGMQAVAQPGGYAGITSNLGPALTPEVSTAIANPMAVNAATPSFGSQMLSQAQTNLGNTVSAGKDFLSSPSTAYKAFTDAGGTAMDLATPVGSAVLSGVEPSDLGYGTGNLYNDPDKDKYRGPQGQLNLSDRFDTGLRLVAKGGYIDGYAMGGTVQSGGIRDLYGTPDNPPAMSSGLGGFGLGRLNDLASEQARSQAQTLGYADGGDVGGNAGADAVDESVPNPEGVVSKYTTVVDDKGVSSRVRVPYQYEKIITKGAEDFYDIPPLEYAANLYPGSILPKFKKEQGYAEGGDVSNYRQDQVALNLDRLPSLNVNTGESQAYVDPNDIKNPSYLMSPFFGFPGGFRGTVGGIEAPTSMNSGFEGPVTVGGVRFPTGMNAPRGYTKGGYLNGQGDGMSDSIPATIEGKQPARLADGEFVIPADVVSHLGNGSSKAGSKRLYAMLDKIRHARTGNKKQGKQINPSKYMPA